MRAFFADGPPNFLRLERPDGGGLGAVVAVDRAENKRKTRLPDSREYPIRANQWRVF